MSTVVILQSNYLPWKGYFDQILQADTFILFDCVQYTRNDWRNRNLIKTQAGPKWLTVPVTYSFRDRLPIDRIVVSRADWAEQHIRAIEASYRRAAAFATEADWLFTALRTAGAMPSLSEINVFLMRELCARIGITTPIISCEDLMDRDRILAASPTDRLVDLCRAAGATRYLSGPAARSYLDTAAFAAAGIEVTWMDYSNYPPYPQQWGDFVPNVSVIDLLLNVGAANALRYIRRDAARGSTPQAPAHD